MHLFDALKSLKDFFFPATPSALVSFESKRNLLSNIVPILVTACLYAFLSIESAHFEVKTSKVFYSNQGFTRGLFKTVKKVAKGQKSYRKSDLKAVYFYAKTVSQAVLVCTI